MYLRRRQRKKGEEEYESWALVESVRCARGPRQRTVATLGKLPGMEKEERVGWEEIARILDGKPRPQASFFEKEEAIPVWAEVALKGVSVERLRHFGDVYLGLERRKRLGLEQFCQERLAPGREEISWSVMATVLVLARFCAPSSELQIAESWYEKTALDDLLGVASDKINDDRLYRALDALLPHKDALCQHLQQKYGELFGATFDFLLYDITSAYFEGSGERNAQAKRGYSRDGRPDCVQVCIGLVVSREEVAPGVEIKMCATPEGAEERFILCRSEGRREKERAILNRFVERLEKALNKLVLQAQEGKIRNRQKVERRIGRLMERYSRAASLFEISVEEISSAEEVRLKVQMHRREERYEWAFIPAEATCYGLTGARAGRPKSGGRATSN